MIAPRHGFTAGASGPGTTKQSMRRAKKLILAGAGMLIAAFFGLNFRRFTADQEGTIRWVLGTLFFVLILLRPKPAAAPRHSAWPIPVTAAVCGMVLSLGGTIFGVHLFEWVGVLLLLYACLRWALPGAYARDTLCAVFLLYWTHPLPSQLFGPLQMTLQKLSVAGAEYLLHCVNVRVWADGMVLRTATRAFEVPLACSGMRTAVTVLLSALGLSVLFRLRWYECFAFLALGLAQVLALNISRICLIQILAADTAQDWETAALHDSLGILLLFAVLLLHFEIWAWRRFRTRWQRESLAAAPGTPEATRRKWLLSAAVSGIALLAGGLLWVLAVRGRPEHRAIMIDEVVEGFVRKRRFADAAKAANAALALAPGNTHLRTRRVQCLALTGRFKQALRELDRVPDDDRNAFHTVAEARILMGLDRPEKAIAKVDALPARFRKLPGVAMLRAEFAALRNATEDVVENLKLVTDRMLMIDRIRALFPYLAVHKQWRAIAACHSDIPYENLTHALITVHALLKINDQTSAGRLLAEADRQWPEDARVMAYLATMARIWPGSEWKRRFTAKMKQRLEKLAAAELANFIEKSFRLGRPDLAWLAYHRLAQKDPRDPALYLILAQFGDVWFLFRKHYLNIPAWDPHEQIDVASFYFISRNWPSAPLARELLRGELDSDRRDGYLRRCIRELARREKDGPLSLRMQMAYVFALQRLGRYREALARLDRLAPATASHATRSVTPEDGVEEGFDFLMSYLREVDRARKADALAERIKNVYPSRVRLADCFGRALPTPQERSAQDPAGRARAQVLNKLREQIKADRRQALETTLVEAIRNWPEEPRLLGYLATVAETRPGSRWEAVYERVLRANLERLDPDMLVACIGNSFRIYRPDLAWLAYSRLENVDPHDPSLYLAPVQFADRWFVFRKRRVGLPAGSEHAVIALGPLYFERKAWPEAPLARELAEAHPGRIREKYLRLCIAELDKRAAAGALPLRLQLLYPEALLLDGRYGEAHTKLDDVARTRPQERPALFSKHAEIYEKQADWRRMYEALRQYRELVDQPPLSISIMQINALMRLGHSAQAMVLAREALTRFPGTPEVHRAIGSIWAVLGDAEEALFALQKGQAGREPPVMSEFFFAAERFVEANRVRRACGMATFPPQRQTLLPRPAEQAVQRLWAPALSTQEMAAQAKTLAADSARMASPFIDGLGRLKADWYQSGGDPVDSDMQRWESVGRDNTERGVALNELAMLLARQQRYAEADTTAQRALVFAPNFVGLWRARVALTEGDPAVIEAARRACPKDGEIWLAELVVQTRAQHTNGWARARIEEAVRENLFSPGVITRAGDFLLRHGQHRAAETAARHAIHTGCGLLPAYVLGLRCALAANNMTWALDCALDAAEFASEPWPFLDVYAAIQMSRYRTDPATLSALERLRKQFPTNPKWGQRLGDAFLQQADPRNAMRVLDPLLERYPKQVDLRTFVLAAEAARRTGNIAKSVSILEAAYAAHPSSRVVLNNLVYTLALDPKTLPRAQSLLPKLLEVWGDSFAVLDTAALVHRQANEFAKAAEFLQKAQQTALTLDPWWAQANVHALDIDAYLGKYDGLLDQGLSEWERFRLAKRRELLIPPARDMVQTVRDREKTPGRARPKWSVTLNVRGTPGEP